MSTATVRQRGPDGTAAAVALAVTGIGVTCRGVTSPETADRPSAAADDWFDVRTELGRHGYKYLPPACQYTVSASRRAVADAGEPPAEPERRAAAMGTNSAAASLHARMDATIVGEGAAGLSPATAPFFSINLFGSRLAIEHGLQAYNLTLTSPRVAGLEALEVGARALLLGRADMVLAGATEAPLAAPAPDGAPDEDGAVVLALEPLERAVARGAGVRGTCRVRTFFLPPSRMGAPGGTDDAVERVRSVVEAFARPDLPPVRAVVGDDPVGGALLAGLEAAGAAVTTVTAGTGSLTPLRHLAALLAEGGDHVVATAAAEGNVAFAVVRAAPISEAAS